MSRTQWYEWFKHFKEGRVSVGEDPSSGRHSKSTDDDHVERVCAVIRGNLRLTVRKVADEVGISIGSCHQIFTENFKCLRDAVHRKRPELSENQTWMLHHDNALAHASLLISSYLAKRQTSIAPHPPYSPDLAPADFFLFPKLKTTLKGSRFQTIEEIQKNVIRELCTITESAFQEAFQQWKKRWRTSPVEGTTLKGIVLKML